MEKMNFQKQLANQALHGHEVEQKSSVFESPTDSSNDYRKVLCEDIDQVCWLIERGILSYKTKDEVVTFLVNRYKIEPGFTTLVWRRLEKENAKFFKAYYVRLKLIADLYLQSTT